MAALQILAIAQATAAVCALPLAQIHRFHFIQLFAEQSLAASAKWIDGRWFAAACKAIRVGVDHQSKAVEIHP